MEKKKPTKNNSNKTISKKKVKRKKPPKIIQSDNPTPSHIVKIIKKILIFNTGLSITEIIRIKKKKLKKN